MFFIADSAWGGKYLQMNTDDDKFPILIRRDSYPGIVRTFLVSGDLLLTSHSRQLSASSAALDLAPLPQTSTARGFRGPEGRGAASEWPQFQAQGQTAETPQATLERQRTATHGAASIDTASSGDRASPRPRGTGAGTLPPPRSSMGGVGTTASGRSSPNLEKKLDAGLGAGKLGAKGYSSSDLTQLSGSGAGYVDTITDQFSNVRTPSLVSIRSR